MPHRNKDSYICTAICAYVVNLKKNRHYTFAIVPPTTPRRSKPVTPVNIQLSVARRSASADDGSHMSSVLAAVAAPLSGRSGCASGHMCRRLSVTSSDGRRGSSQPLRAGPVLSLARPGPHPARVTGPAHTLILSGWLWVRPVGPLQRLGREKAATTDEARDTTTGLSR